MAEVLERFENLEGYKSLESRAIEIIRDEAKAKRILIFLNSAFKLIIDSDDNPDLRLRPCENEEIDFELYADSGKIVAVRNDRSENGELEARSDYSLALIPLRWDRLAAREDEGRVRIFYNQ
ncbi:MAG: hypothetical protein QF632_04475 [Candidatus Woesearchaeota archaeon]|jgi:hypothetical protein|nr:hypothetical protein [Candidatus Woesearchaeota archaeon]